MNADKCRLAVPHGEASRVWWAHSGLASIGIFLQAAVIPWAHSLILTDMSLQPVVWGGGSLSAFFKAEASQLKSPMAAETE